MLDMPPDSCIDEPGSPLCAADVARGVIRMLLRHDLTAMTEVPLDGGRRADLMAVDARGQIVIVEIKVSRADLLGDGKWPDYLGHCDRYFWAVPAGFDCQPLDDPAFLPARIGYARAAEMAMLGERVPAGQALEWGLVNEVVPDDGLEDEAGKLL